MKFVRPESLFPTPAGTHHRIISWGLDEQILEHRDPIAFRPPRYLTLVGHTDMIMDMVVLPSINALASCTPCSVLVAHVLSYPISLESRAGSAWVTRDESVSLAM
jgi:hypothetical protein